MRKVLIATPSYDGKLDVWYVNALTESIRLGLANDIFFQPIYMSYDALVQRARNDLLAIAVENDFDDIIWIDSDMEWHPQWLLQLLSYEEDVVGGACVKKSVEEQYNVKCQPENLIQNEKGLIEIEGIGTGFLRMSRKAYMSLWKKSLPYKSNGAERRWAFEVKMTNGEIVSEDITACDKLRKAGFKIYLDPNITCNHIGTLKFTGNFKQFMTYFIKPAEEVTDINVKRLVKKNTPTKKRATS